jgi:RHS repeat-associated protein
MASVNMSGSNCATNGDCIVYDALGRPVEIDAGSGKTEIWYTQLGKTAYMSGATLNYLRFPGPGGGSAMYTASTSEVYWNHPDWMGSARIVSRLGASPAVVTDRAFAPYGEAFNIFGGTSQNETMFASLTQDTFSGMYDTPNREVTAVQSRFMSPDPAGAGWNQYAWPTNPNNFSDRSGLGECTATSPGGCTATGTYYGWAPIEFPNSVAIWLGWFFGVGSVAADGAQAGQVSAGTDSSCPSAGPPCLSPGGLCFGSLCETPSDPVDAGSADQTQAPVWSPSINNTNCPGFSICVSATVIPTSVDGICAYYSACVTASYVPVQPDFNVVNTPSINTIEGRIAIVNSYFGGCGGTSGPCGGYVKATKSLPPAANSNVFPEYMPLAPDTNLDLAIDQFKDQYNDAVNGTLDYFDTHWPPKCPTILCGND